MFCRSSPVGCITQAVMAPEARRSNAEGESSPLATCPYAGALFAWNLLNVGLVYLAIRLVVPPAQRLPAIQLTGIGLVTTIDGTQSNGLVAGLIVLAFAALERDRLLLAATSIATGALVKLFPLAAVAFVI